ncbi:TorF family putative porin [Sphingomonas aracearum]|uniref:Porin n=1 Tax=Sphingomonas aracearum TaxID=2283317 RepID=A0A369VVM8_9SPHN|nr:TorF family putative porin [Sphingomonas aracearum]RDE05230.1 hypothetical protein DVW87_08130 [Sphingomonas aracearum]
MSVPRPATLALILGLLPVAAHAQVSAGVEATTDERRRGLSWSDGDPSVSADVQADVWSLQASARAVALRGSPRHRGAEAVADLTLAKSIDLSAFRLRASATGHFFVDAADRMDYWEAGADASYSLGPLQVEAGASIAPAQRAIGGSNLYVYAGASAGIPATPVTLSAAVGHTSGSEDRLYSDRLRPGGDYTDWRVGIERTIFPLTLGLDYVGTDRSERRPAPIGDPRNSGDRVLARARLSF